MRKRNIKINVFLNDKVLNKDIDEAIIFLSNISNNLSKFSNKLNRLCYYDFVDFFR